MISNQKEVKEFCAGLASDLKFVQRKCCVWIIQVKKVTIGLKLIGNQKEVKEFCADLASDLKFAQRKCLVFEKCKLKKLGITVRMYSSVYQIK